MTCFVPAQSFDPDLRETQLLSPALGRMRAEQRIQFLHRLRTEELDDLRGWTIREVLDDIFRRIFFEIVVQ